MELLDHQDPTKCVQGLIWQHQKRKRIKEKKKKGHCVTSMMKKRKIFKMGSSFFFHLPPVCFSIKTRHFLIFFNQVSFFFQSLFSVSFVRNWNSTQRNKVLLSFLSFFEQQTVTDWQRGENLLLLLNSSTSSFLKEQGAKKKEIEHVTLFRSFFFVRSFVEWEVKGLIRTTTDLCYVYANLPNDKKTLFSLQEAKKTLVLPYLLLDLFFSWVLNGGEL